MENQDKIYDRFKEAAGKAERKDFARMKAVWNRVEEKLDNKKQRRIAAWWKYTGMAALFLLFMGIGVFMLNNEKNSPIVAPEGIPENSVTAIDTQKVKEIFDPAKAVVITETKTAEGTPMGVMTSETYDVTIAEPDQPGGDLAKGYLASPAENVKSKDKLVSESSLSETVATEPTNNIITSASKKTEENQFNGIITDSQGIPIPGVNVMVKGTKKSTLTDFDGKYMIDAKEGEKLIASFIGLQTQTITLGKRKENVNLQLKDDTQLFENVVMDGYRTTTRAQSNVAVTTVTPKTIEDRSNADFIQTLQGQTPGLNISTGSGQPGANSSAILREYPSMNGNIEPLYIIDGVPLDADSFRQINPNDIVSINILKDEGAISIYGHRANNGVIIVKTKNALTKKEKRKLGRERKKLEKNQKKKDQEETN